MCGISVLINKKNNSIKESDLKKINNVINHRGPDNEGYFLNKNVGLAHRRLSIIDLSEDANQPMKSGENILVFNGEIYNYLELKEELKSKDISFKTKSDSEVILKSYEYWGENCFERFNGMWAICIFDQENQKIIISRDRFGIKPLYSYENDEYIIYSSEIKQILAFTEKPIVANGNILLDYLTLGFENHTSETFYSDINIFLPSTYSTISLVDFKQDSYIYYDLKKNNLIGRKNDLIKKYKELLDRSIKYRLRSDVKVGACLSGGLDSSSIVALASKKYENSHPFIVFHVHTSEDERFSELKYVKKLIENLNVELIKIDVNSNDLKKYIDDTIRTQEEPFGSLSVVLQYILMKKAKSLNCKVLLDGQGGDETLLGYERYYPSQILTHNFLKIPYQIKKTIKNSKLNLINIIAYIFYFTSYRIKYLYVTKRTSFLRKSIKSQINKKIIKEHTHNYKNIYELQRMEIFKTQLPHLLRYEDKNSMNFSIETRLPLLDHDLVSFTYNIPFDLKIFNGWTKYILRNVMDKIMPKQITWRKNKIGFELPENDLYKLIRPQMLNEISSSKIINQIASINKIQKRFNRLDNRTKWRLYNIARWEKLNNIRSCEFK